MVVHGEDFLGQTGVEQGAGFVHDEIDHGAGFGVVEVFLDHFGAAARVDEVVEADARHFEFAQQLEDLGDFDHVALVDGEAQADLEALGLAVFKALQRLLEGVGHAAELVVDLFRAVQRDADVGKIDGLEFAGLFLGDQGAVGGDDRAHALFGGVAREFGQILTDQRFAAGEQHDGSAVGGEIGDDGLALFRGDFVLPLGIDGLRVAVHALEVTTAGHVPDHHRLLVFGELEQVGRELAGMATVAQRVGRLHLAAVQLGNADHGNSLRWFTKKLRKNAPSGVSVSRVVPLRRSCPQ